MAENESENAELAALRAESDKIARERVDLIEKLSKKSHSETQTRVFKEQLEDDKAKLEQLKAKLLAPPEERSYARLKTEGLDEGSAAVLRRIFVLDSGKTWTPDRAQMLVDRMISIPLAQRQIAAHELLNQIATGEMDGKLDFVSVMGGSGGIFENPRRLATDTVDSLVQQIESMPPEAREAAKKAVSAALKKGAKKIQGINDSATSSTKRVSGPKHERTEDEVIDDAPHAPEKSNPWGDFE